MYCPDCGFHQSAEGHTFCERCGARLPQEASGGQTTGPFAIPDPTGEVVPGQHGPVEGPAFAIRSGGGVSGQVFRLAAGSTVSLGRDPDADIFLDDVTVSRRHAEVSVGDDVTLSDLGSLNGTYVNRRRIDEAETLLGGDEIQIGKFRLVFIR